jgi:hypothetical protein
VAPCSIPRAYLPGVWPIERSVTKYTVYLSIYQYPARECAGSLTIYAPWMGVIFWD